MFVISIRCSHCFARLGLIEIWLLHRSLRSRLLSVRQASGVNGETNAECRFSEFLGGY